MNLFARTTFSVDPAWPLMTPGLGMGAFSAAALVLVGLTVWTYLGVHAASWRRMAIVLALRLVALAITLLLILRPSFATEEEDAIEPTRLLLLVDRSRSMAARDEFGGLSRLEHVHRVLASNSAQRRFQQLQEEKKVEFLLFQGADDLKRYDPEAKADGKLTDIHLWLDQILKEQAGQAKIQALLLFSDGADTGEPLRTLQKAKEYRGLFPIHALGVGQASSLPGDKDIALDRIEVEPKVLLAKGKMKVVVLARAPGFENAQANVSLWLEDRTTGVMKRALERPQRLTQALDNEIVLETDAPDQEGEIRITVKVEPLPGEATNANNEITTFAHVSKEGVRILWVEGKRRFESVFAIRHALGRDRRFRVVYVEKLNSTSADKENADPYELEKKTYDVVVIGDVPANRFADRDTFTKIRRLVQDQGMGVVMLGGYDTFAQGNWPASPLADLFPVKFDRRGQLDEKARMAPTSDGLQFLLRLADDPKENTRLWTKVLDPLEGITAPGTRDPRAIQFAGLQSDPETPLLAGVTRGKGRLLTFAGDTTWQAWRRTPEAQAAYERFWRQMMLWLAQQENVKGNVFVELGQRRMDRGRTPQLGFRVGFRGIEVKNPRFVVKAIGPKKEEYPLSVASDERGTWRPPAPGEYLIRVDAKGTTSDGKPIDGHDQARFLVFEEDRETQGGAADHDFLTRLAEAAEGRFDHAEERSLLQLLDELQTTQGAPQVRVRHWPDWRRTPTGPGAGDQFATLWRSTALACLLVYIGCLCAEWYLRRRWGLV